ncbi:MAG: DivIVA domain-containing protein [Clostridiales bacterium]|nr:DivIVA domain-containing protein [Clostridiales bacterium]
MLTPDKIREKTFQTTGKGSYRSDDVDYFMNEVSASYEQMFKENADLVRKITILAKKVEEYREDEDSLKMALINAQKLADRIVAEAKENSEAESAKIIEEARSKTANAAADAERVISEANTEADSILANAKTEAEKIVNDANKEAIEKLGNVNRQITHKTLEFDMLKKEASKFKSELKSMYEKHITLINQLPEIAEEMDDEDPDYGVPEDTAETPAYEPVAGDEDEVAPVYETVVEETQEEAEETVDATEESEEAEEAYAEPAFEIVPENNADEDQSDDEDFGFEAFAVAEDKTDEADIEIVPADSDDTTEDYVSDSYFNIEEEDDKKNKFKLDLSKIDFSDDGFEDEPEPSISFERSFSEIEEEPQTEDEDDSSNSFKNFFKKKK